MHREKQVDECDDTGVDDDDCEIVLACDSETDNLIKNSYYSMNDIEPRVGCLIILFIDFTSLVILNNYPE